MKLYSRRHYRKYIRKQKYIVERVAFEDGDKEYAVHFVDPKFKDVVGADKKRRKAIKEAFSNLEDWLDWYYEKQYEESKNETTY